MSQAEESALPAAELFDQLYADLKRIARRQLAAGGGTLQTTGLVHEAFLKLASAQVVDKAHLLNLASRAMRQVLVDLARRKASEKHGGGLRLQTFGTTGAAAEERDPLDVLALEQCLERLEHADPRLARVVELHFFGGLSFPEMSEVLKVGERTLFRDWRTARAMIHADLSAMADAARRP